MGPNWPLLGSIRLSCITASDYISWLTYWSLSDILYSDKCQMKKAFQYVKIMLSLFCAVVKFCSTNRLFTFVEVNGMKSALR